MPGEAEEFREQTLLIQQPDFSGTLNGAPNLEEQDMAVLFLDDLCPQGLLPCVHLPRTAADQSMEVAPAVLASGEADATLAVRNRSSEAVQVDILARVGPLSADGWLHTHWLPIGVAAVGPSFRTLPAVVETLPAIGEPVVEGGADGPRDEIVLPPNLEPGRSVIVRGGGQGGEDVTLTAEFEVAPS